MFDSPKRSIVLFIIMVVFLGYQWSQFEFKDALAAEVTNDKVNVASQSISTTQSNKILNQPLDSFARELFLQRSKILSLEEQVLTLKRQIKIIQKGMRSGMIEDEEAFKKIVEALDSDETTDVQAAEPIVEKPNLQDVALASKQNKKKESQPLELLSSAEIKLERGEFSQALKDLETLKEAYPNYSLNSKEILLTAKSQLKLKMYSELTETLHQFYLKNSPGSEFYLDAKFIEAQSFESQSLFDKASFLYQEVLALSPNSPQAKSARQAIIRIRQAF